MSIDGLVMLTTGGLLEDLASPLTKISPDPSFEPLKQFNSYEIES